MTKDLFSFLSRISSGSYRDSGEFDEDYDDDDDDDDVEVDYQCPFCSDDYDLVELCHHIDEEHQLEATHGVCQTHILSLHIIYY